MKTPAALSLLLREAREFISGGAFCGRGHEDPSRRTKTGLLARQFTRVERVEFPIINYPRGAFC